MKVSRIKLKGFRGATAPMEVPLDVTKQITLIFGENGTGKSTIADAFDFLCNGSIGSLEVYSIGADRKKYLASLGTDPSEVTVTLESGNDSWTATLERGRTDNNAAEPPTARILRRKAILTVIEAIPSRRFEEVRSFVSLPFTEASENGLREAVRRTKFNFDEYTHSVTQADQAMEQLWRDEGSPEENALAWAESEAAKDPGVLQKNVQAAEKLLSTLHSVDGSVKAVETARRDRAIAEVAYSQAEQKLREAEAEHLQHSSDLLVLLQRATAYIDIQPGIENCPVCENKVSILPLRERLETRIASMRSLNQLLEIQKQAKARVDESVAHLNQRLSDVRRDAMTLKSAFAENDLPTEIKGIIQENRWLEVFSDQNLPEDAENKARQVLAGSAAFVDIVRKNNEFSRKSINLRNAVKAQINTYREKTSLARSEETALNKLVAMLEILSHERKEYVESILRSISGDVERLYTQIHPGESIGGVRFYLRPNMINSLEFDARFHGVADQPPQAYYSESHLDTLGICIFLALTKLYRTDNTVVILDDVLTSVDDQHLDRFMNLLHAETPNLGQLIVTTHYRPWRDRYRWARGPASNTQLIELGPWTLQSGIRTAEFQSALNELRNELTGDRFDRQASSSKAGVILESLLDFITLKFRCRVARNARNEHSLGDLVQGIDSKLSRLLRSRKATANGEWNEIEIKPLVDAATSEQWIRNTVGCHFNVAGSQVSDGVVKDFCERVAALADSLICTPCGALPTRKPSGSYWQCGCGKLQLYPLIHPDADQTMVDDEA